MTLTEILVPPEIASDGSVDVTDLLNSFFASVPDGSVVVFPVDAVYLHENSLHASWRDVLVEGNGATLRANTDGSGLPAWDGKQINWPRQRHHLRILNSQNVTIRNLNVKGPNSEARYDVTKEAQHGFLVNASRNVLLESCNVTDVWGDAVSIVGIAEIVTIRGGTFSGCGRQGFAIDDASDVIFEGFVLERVARSAVDVEPQLAWECHRVTIRNGLFRAPIANAIFANLGTGAGVTDIVFEDNTIEGRHMSMICGNDTPGERARYTFRNNVADKAVNKAPVFKFENVTHIVVEHNTQPFAGKGVQATGAGVEFRQGCCGRVENNSFPYSGGTMTESSGVVSCAPNEAVEATEATGAV